MMIWRRSDGIKGVGGHDAASRTDRPSASLFMVRRNG
jgi:hypothetical protein